MELFLLCRRKELTQWPRLCEFYSAHTARISIQPDALVISPDFTLTHGLGSSQLCAEYFTYRGNIRRQQRLFINISEYVSVNHLSASERKCCSRKILAGRCKINQESPCSECCSHKMQDTWTFWDGRNLPPHLLGREPESELNKVISTAPSPQWAQN